MRVALPSRQFRLARSVILNPSAKLRIDSVKDLLFTVLIKAKQILRRCTPQNDIQTQSQRRVKRSLREAGRKLVSRQILGIMGAILLVFLSGYTVHALDGASILKKVDANLQPESFESYRMLINIEPSGAKREFLLYTLKKGHDKVVSLFLSPASEKGRATLRLGDNMWLYIPDVGRAIRITSLQSVVGGVFNNADIMRLDYAVEYDVVDLEEQGNEYVLDLKAKTGAVAYDRLKMWVDKKNVVPTKIECYAATGLLIKTLYFKERKSFDDGIVRPSVVETDSPLYKGYQSIMVYARMKRRVVPDEVFTLEFLPKVDTIR